MLVTNDLTTGARLSVLEQPGCFFHFSNLFLSSGPFRWRACSALFCSILSVLSSRQPWFSILALELERCAEPWSDWRSLSLHFSCFSALRFGATMFPSSAFPAQASWTFIPRCLLDATNRMLVTGPSHADMLADERADPAIACFHPGHGLEPFLENWICWIVRSIFGSRCSCDWTASVVAGVDAVNAIGHLSICVIVSPSSVVIRVCANHFNIARKPLENSTIFRELQSKLNTVWLLLCDFVVIMRAKPVFAIRWTEQHSGEFTLLLVLELGRNGNHSSNSLFLGAKHTCVQVNIRVCQSKYSTIPIAKRHSIFKFVFVFPFNKNGKERKKNFNKIYLPASWHCPVQSACRPEKVFNSKTWEFSK